MQYIHVCTKDPVEDSTGNWYESPVRNLHQVCKDIVTYASDRKGMSDIIERDSYALSGKVSDVPINVDIYAIICLWNGEYYGHIYSWIANDMSFAMGIRNRWDYPSIKGSNNDPFIITGKPISWHILEGARIFASMNGFKEMNIVEPMEVMVPILTKLGFKSAEISDEYIEISLLSTTYVEASGEGWLTVFKRSTESTLFNMNNV